MSEVGGMNWPGVISFLIFTILYLRPFSLFRPISSQNDFPRTNRVYLRDCCSCIFHIRQKFASIGQSSQFNKKNLRERMAWIIPLTIKIAFI